MARRSWGTLRRLSSGRWQARFRTASGKQVGVPGTFVAKGEASRALARLQADNYHGPWLDPKAGRVTLDTYADTWISSRLVSGRPLAPRTAELYRSLWRLHISPALGSIERGRLEAAAVRAWHGSLLLKGPGRSTVAKSYRLLRAACQTATEDDLIARNPVAIRGAGQERTTERPMFTMAQVDALAGAVDERWRALILMAAWAGLRSSELAALRRHRLDLDGGTVTVAGAT